MKVSAHQVRLADLIEKGLKYRSTDPTKAIKENLKWHLHDLGADSFLDDIINSEQRSTVFGFYADAMGYALVGKIGDPKIACNQLELLRKRNPSASYQDIVMTMVGIPKSLFEVIDDLQTIRGVRSKKLVYILRNQRLH